MIMVDPLVNLQKAIEAIPVEIVDLLSYKMVDLSIVMIVYQSFFLDLLYIGDYHNTIGIHVCLEILTSWR